MDSPSLSKTPDPLAKEAGRTASEPTCDYASEAAAAQLVKILDQYLAELKAGHVPNKADLLAQHPDLASQLEACLAGLEFIHQAETAGPSGLQRLGDFRIIREVGRGGMGAVFEAEQMSLGRKVALKILRFGGVSDPEAVERFQREAETVAKLHHTNIVPIFAVGSERGVNYYAMQFIEGESLADVLARKNGGLAGDQVASWGLQAAEALAHAHQRGVIHRDVKPSNLILDNENRLWLTDFGLARRMDDVTLSMTGALLGTPRYMSPEQAVASKGRVDHRSDLFSLGATLYELVAGQPAFTGDSPHDVIQQIITAEPMPIRQIAQGVPRDLETIVMKCLAKEPAERYESAEDLANDLRAFLDGRPIRARRASLAELAVRWLKAQQRSVKLTAAAVAATLVVTLGSIAGWFGYDAWRQSSIKLGAATPPLVVEVTAAKGEVARVETAPMQNAASLPGGDYQLRISTPGTLSETFGLKLQRGSASEHTLDLRDQMLWLPSDVSGAFELVDFGDERGLFFLNDQLFGGHGGIQKRREPTMMWSVQLGTSQLPDPDKSPGFRWNWTTAAISKGYGPFDLRPWVAPQAMDLNGDGTGDLLIAGRHQAWLLAISGAGGKVLWFSPVGQDVSSTFTPASGYGAYAVTSAVVGEPILDCDCDRDGVRDIIATVMDIGNAQQGTIERWPAPCSINAISGKTGQTLWMFPLPAAWLEMPASEEIPYDLRWFAGASAGTMSGGSASSNDGRRSSRKLGRVERTGLHRYLPAGIRLAQMKDGPTVEIVAGKFYATLGANDGKLKIPAIDMGVRPGKPALWADADGDGASELVLLEIAAVGAGTGPGPTTQPRIAVWSPSRKQALWSKLLSADWPLQPSMMVKPPQWPLVADLNRDGKCEIVVPTGRSAQQVGLAIIPWGFVSLLDGGSGDELWRRRLTSVDQEIQHFSSGPDIDGDGYGEVFVATLEGGDFTVFVDALSGKGGQTLWTSYEEAPPSNNSSRQLYLMPLQWWNSPEDGWPQLLVQLVQDDSMQSYSSLMSLSAGTGRLLHSAQQIASVRPADMDGDGIEDLVMYDNGGKPGLDVGGKVHLVRGSGGEAWARLGDFGEPVADFDGDGVTDLVRADWGGTLVATSGATGSPLWKHESLVSIWHLGFRSAAPRDSSWPSKPVSGDLNGDGTTDLLVVGKDQLRNQGVSCFHAISGKSGKLLWSTTDISCQVMDALVFAQAADLDGDGKEEALWMANLDYGYPSRRDVSTQESQLWLFVTSGQTGKLKWAQPLSPAYGQARKTNLQVLVRETQVTPTIGDIDGDGTKDVIAPAILNDDRNMETRVLSGEDGSTLWTRPFPPDPNRQASLANWVPPTSCDLEGDGAPEVAFSETGRPDPSKPSQFPFTDVVVVNGKDGRQCWKWTSDVPTGHWYEYRQRGPMLQPVVLRRDKKRQRLMVCLPANTTKLAVLEPDGMAQSWQVASLAVAAPPFACDADGDGCDEVVYLTDTAVCLAKPDKLDAPLWTRPTLVYGGHRFLGIISRGPKQSPVIAVALHVSDNSIWGLDAASGKLVWACPGPISRDGANAQPLRQLSLLSSGVQEPRLFFFAYGSVARVRQAAPLSVELGGGIAMAHSNRESIVKLTALKHDPRWAREFPWTPQNPDDVAFYAWSMFYGALLVVLPAAYIGRLIYLRQFSLKMLLVLPIVAGLFLTAALMKSPTMDNDFRSAVARIWIGLIFAPPVVGIGCLAWWSVKGEWKQVALWSLLTVMVSLVVAALWLLLNRDKEPMLPEEYYAGGSWYLVWFAGAYLTSWLLMLGLPLRMAVLWGWSKLSRKRGTPQMESVVAKNEA